PTRRRTWRGSTPRPTPRTACKRPRRRPRPGPTDARRGSPLAVPSRCARAVTNSRCTHSWRTERPGSVDGHSTAAGAADGSPLPAALDRAGSAGLRRADCPSRADHVEVVERVLDGHLAYFAEAGLVAQLLELARVQAERAQPLAVGGQRHRHAE